MNMPAVVPDSSVLPFRHQLDASLLSNKANLERYDTGIDEFASLIEKDTKRVFPFKYDRPEDLISKGTFASYEGDVNAFVSGFRNRERLGFLILIYLGRTQNKLKAQNSSTDLSMIIFFSRLSMLCSELERMTSKEAKITVAVENTFFERNIFRSTADPEAEIRNIRRLLSDFEIKRICFEPVQKFLGEGYIDSFNNNLEALKRRESELKADSNFNKMFSLFYGSYPTKSFDEALSLYSAGTNPEISEWALESTIRYMAFFNARDETDFWGRNSDFIRSTDSNRKGVLSFRFSIGRLSPTQGTSTTNKGEIGTEYYYDIVKASSMKNETINFLCYKGAEMCVSNPQI